MNRLAEAVLAVSAWYLVVVLQAPFVAGCQCAFRVHALTSCGALGLCRWRWRLRLLGFLEAELGGLLVLVPGARYLRPLAPRKLVSCRFCLCHAPAWVGAFGLCRWRLLLRWP